MRRWIAFVPAGLVLAVACRCASPGPAPRDAASPAQPPAAATSAVMDRRDASGATIAAPTPPLTNDETQRAADIALRELTARNLRLDGPLYFIDAELLRDKHNPARRVALVQHYRYAGAVTITSLVDLQEQRVIEQRTERNVPTPLSVEEAEEARRIARADPAVQRILASHENVVIEPMLIQTRDPDDPIFGRRVVRLLFRTGRNYISGREQIQVDLNDRRVIVLPPRRRQPHP